MKTCTKCKQEKELSAFGLNRGEYINSWCKECKRELNRSLYKKNPIVFLEATKRWAKNHPERMRKLWREREQRRKQEDPEGVKERKREYCLRHPERRKLSCKKWSDKNKDRVNATYIRYAKRRRNNDMAFRIHLNLHNQIWAALKHKKNWTSWTRILGYTAKDLINYLEPLFKPGMTWGNYGKWHIDHIKPKKKFSVEQIKECWALSNLQPLWASENCSKGAK